MPTLLILARAIYFASGMVLVSGVMFRWLILRPILAQGSPLRFHFLMKGSTLMLIFSGFALFWITAAIMSGVSLLEAPSEFYTVLLQTGFGTMCLFRAGFAVLLIIGLCFFHETILACAAVGLLISSAWIDHVVAAPGSFVAGRIAADAAHLFSSSVWPTGLLFFSLFLREARKGAFFIGEVIAVTRRFSRVSLFAVVTLMMTGVINACSVLGHFSALIDTVYGRLLCLKLFLFLLMLGFASWNRFRLLPLLASEQDSSMTESLLSRLRYFVRAELSLGIAIVIVVAVLGVMPP